MMTSNACDAGKLQAEQRKRSKYRIITMPSNASDPTVVITVERLHRGCPKPKTQSGMIDNFLS
jgi:hypothetical protein